MTKLRWWMCLWTVACVLVPSEGHAFSWWRLNKLSGPQFQGVASEVRLKCWATPGVRAAPDDQGRLHNRMPGVVFSLCPRDPRRRHSLNLDASALWSDPDDQFADGERIGLGTVGVSFSTRPNEVFELGTGVHVAGFFADGIGPVYKVMLEPARLDLRLLQDRFAWDESPPTAWWREAIVVRAGLVWFPSGFDEQELGPIADDDTLVGYVGIFLDVGF